MSYKDDETMTFTQIEEAYQNYVEIEYQLTPEERLKYLKGFQELIKLFKLNTELELLNEDM